MALRDGEILVTTAPGECRDGLVVVVTPLASEGDARRWGVVTPAGAAFPFESGTFDGNCPEGNTVFEWFADEEEFMYYREEKKGSKIVGVRALL